MTLRVHKGFYQAFVGLNEGTMGIKEKLDVVKEATKGAVPIYITGIHWAAHSLKLPERCLAAIRLRLVTPLARRASAIFISIYG